jgi:hypothetical protein
MEVTPSGTVKVVDELNVCEVVCPLALATENKMINSCRLLDLGRIILITIWGFS